MQIDVTDPLPRYAQIESLISAGISDGSLPTGSQLPPEDALAARYGVSRTTIRTTIQNLARRGLVEIRRGRGTFVTEPKMTQELTMLTGFAEDMQALGKTATARLIDHAELPAPRVVAEALKLTVGTPVTRIRRVRLADGTPVSFDETYLPTELGRKVVTDDLEKEPIFALLEQKYATPLVEAEYRLEAVAAERRIAKALRLEVGSPIFLIERTSYSDGHRPVDYEKLYYNGDQIRFVTKLRRPSARSAGAR